MDDFQRWMTIGEEYLRQGLSIIPIGLEKKPLLQWKQYQSQRPTTEEVKTWCRMSNFQGFGVVTGSISGIFVLDIDDGANIENLDFPSTPTVQTGGGGQHYYFQYPKDISVKNQTSILPHVDIRGNGGYAVLPPTRHPSGVNYRWITDFSTPMAEMPQWLKDRLTKQLAIPKFNPQLIQGVPGGQRNDTAARLIGKLLRHLPSHEWETTAWPLIESWNQRNNPPLSQIELRRTYDSIASREYQRRQAGGSNGGQPIRETTDLSSDRLSLEPKLLSELNSEIGDVEWLWEGFLAKGHMTLFSALWKSGKTTLIAHLLKCIEKQRPLAGREVKLSKVLILSEESEALWVRRREDYSLEGNIWISSRPIKQKLNDKEWLNLLKEIADFCKQKTIDLFILDTLSGFWAVDNENDAARISSALIPVNCLLGQNIAVLLVHHFRKSGGSEGTASRGSGALGSAADILVEFSRMNGDDPNSTQRVLKTYSRFEESPREVVIELINDEYVTLGTKAEVSKAEKLKKVLMLLPNTPDGVTISELLEGWDKDYGSKPSKRSIRRYIDELNKQGKARVVGEKLVEKTMAPLYGRVAETILPESTLEKNAGQTLTSKPLFEADNAGQDRPDSMVVSVLGDGTSDSNLVENMPDWELEQIFGAKVVYKPLN